MTNILLFPDWSRAFSYCREVDRPILAQVCDREVLKIFPSGATKDYRVEPGTRLHYTKIR